MREKASKWRQPSKPLNSMSILATFLCHVKMSTYDILPDLMLSTKNIWVQIQFIMIENKLFTVQRLNITWKMWNMFNVKKMNISITLRPWFGGLRNFLHKTKTASGYLKHWFPCHIKNIYVNYGLLILLNFQKKF